MSWGGTHASGVRFVYQVVVPRALASKELTKVFDSGEKIVLPLWDPMVRFSLLVVFNFLMDGSQGSLA